MSTQIGGGNKEPLDETLQTGNTTGGTDIVVSGTDVIKSSANTNEINLNDGNQLLFSTDNSSYTETYVYLNSTEAVMSDANGNAFQINTTTKSTQMLNEGGSLAFTNINYAAINQEPLTAYTTSSISSITIAPATANRSKEITTATALLFNTGEAGNTSTYNSGVNRSVILGGRGITAKTNDTAYINQLGLVFLNNAFEQVLRAVNVTADRTYQLPDVQIGSNEIAIVGQAPGGVYAQTVQSATISTVGEQSIVGTGVGTLSVPANSFKVGDSFHAKIGGVINSTGGGGNSEITVRVKNGAVVLASSGVFDLDNSTNEGWELEIDFTLATIGATGSISTNGNFEYTKTNDKKLSGTVFQDVQAIDTTVSNILDITVEWNVLNGGDDIYSANFVLYKTFGV